MPRTRTPFTRAQVQQNAAFLASLSQTGNARLASRETGLSRPMMLKRRANYPLFGEAWEAALAAAHARFHLAGGRRAPEGKAPRSEEQTPARTKGGEPIIIATGGKGVDGKPRYQLRLAPAGQMTRAGEQAYLRALSATANKRLSALAVGFAHSTIDRRAARDPGFAREARKALEIGFTRIRAALLAGSSPMNFMADQWCSGAEALPPIPAMTPEQVLQLLALHDRSVMHGETRAHRFRLSPGESHFVRSQRLAWMWRADKRREAEDRDIRAAMDYEGTGEWRNPAGEDGRVELPPLDQVTAWEDDKAKRKAAKARKRAAEGRPEAPGQKPGTIGGMYGGWSIGDWKG